MGDFADWPDLPMVAVGAVDARSARLWARAPGARAIDVAISPAGAPTARARVRVPVDAEADHTVTFRIPDDAPGLEALAPDHVHLFRVLTEDDRLIGEGRFRTAPAADAPCTRLTFAIASCHQPFAEDATLMPASVRMLEAAERALDARDVRFLLLMGDQIYADLPASRSLFGPFFREVAPPGRATVTDCTPEEVRRLYHARHRAFFGVAPFRQLQAHFASYPMLDDHEVRDNFGSAPEHAQDGFNAVRAGARAAFHDYQVSRVIGPKPALPPSFHYEIEHGPLAVFVMDVRSERRTDDTTMTVYGDAQFSDLRLFLAAHADKPALAVVITVPPVHLERGLSHALTALLGEDSDPADRWANPKALPERNRLLRLLRDHQRNSPAQRLVVLAGDIHVGCLLRLEWSDGSPALYQLTSSAMSNGNGALQRIGAERLLDVVREVDTEDGVRADVALVPGAGRNPYGGLNIGIVSIEIGAEATRIDFQLLGEPDGDGVAPVVYESGPF